MILPERLVRPLLGEMKTLDPLVDRWLADAADETTAQAGAP